MTAPRIDGRVDCPACGHHGSRCQEDRDDGSTVCHETGATLDTCEGCGRMTHEPVELGTAYDTLKFCPTCAKVTR